MSITLVIGNKNYSSWSLRPWLYLKYHQIAFEELKIPLYQGDYKSKILNYSPSGKVPVLIDGNIKVWDSLAILEYLAERFSQFSAWPKDVTERALARSLSAEMHAGFSALRTHCGMDCRRLPESRQLPDAVYADVARIGEIWQQCRRQHGEAGPWLFGQFSIVDAMYAPIAIRLHSYLLETNNEAQAYQNMVLDHPLLKEWIAAAKTETEVIE